MSGETAEQVPSIPLTPLVVQLMEMSSRDLEWTTNQLIDGYKASAERAEATVALIRDRVCGLLDGPYMPSPTMLERALYPSSAAVDAAIAGGRGSM